MFAYLLVLINVIISALGIYLFDYRIDTMINQPSVILLSIVAGSLSMIIVFFLYIEVFYLLVAKNKPQNSMIKHYFAKQIMTVPLFVSNTRIKIIGLEHLPKDPGFTIYANHTSMMDIAVLMYSLRKYPIAFLAKKTIRNLLGIGKWTPELGCVMIDRSNPRKGAESIVNVIKNVKAGSTMVIFPEGTRSPHLGKLIDFKAGSFKVALKSKAPLLPITIKKASNFKKVIWPMPKRITLIIHDAIPFDDFNTMTSNELADKVKSIIESAL